MFWTRKFGNSLLNNDSGEGADQTNTHDSKDTGGMKIDKGLTKSPFNSNDIVQNIKYRQHDISTTKPVEVVELIVVTKQHKLSDKVNSQVIVRLLTIASLSVHSLFLYLFLDL